MPLLASITATSEEADLRQTLSTLNELAYIYQLSQDEFKASSERFTIALNVNLTNTSLHLVFS